MGVVLKYALGAALVALATVYGLLALERSESTALRSQNANLSRSVAALTEQAQKSALAREVEAARVVRWTNRAAELDASIEALRTGDFNDEILDPRIAAIVNGWLPTGD
ncbi:hypothetical protein AB9F29_16645 [Falsihalocynthiibacter sp. S25ZX9]|uniref:hypothetical protein n=1 Tax=Falsihalocynthiibacter sp. S25ZX9 TaxID=3240870 RepID=UPI00350E9893